MIMVLTHDQRIQIVTLRREDYSYSDLAQRFNVQRATIIKKHDDTGSTDDLP